MNLNSAELVLFRQIGSYALIKMMIGMMKMRAMMMIIMMMSRRRMRRKRRMMMVSVAWDMCHRYLDILPECDVML